jgi:drug/metabolite transporter (DMT)-like permease
LETALHNRSRLAVLAAAILFSTGGAAIKATTLTSWQTASFRSGVAAVALFLLLPETRVRWTARMAAVGLLYALTLILFVTANKLTTSANAIYLQAGTPLYVALFSPWLLKEPVARRDLAMFFPLAAGLALFFFGEPQVSRTAPNPPLGNIFAILSGLTFAFTLIGLRAGEKHGESRSAVATVALGNLIAFLLALPLALPVHAQGIDFVAIGYLGVFQIGLAYTLLGAGLRHVTAVESSLLLLAEPALNPVWSFFAHGETPNLWSVSGGVLILGATIARLFLR